jgi:hypothetical protein
MDLPFDQEAQVKCATSSRNFTVLQKAMATKFEPLLKLSIDFVRR